MWCSGVVAFLVCSMAGEADGAKPVPASLQKRCLVILRGALRSDEFWPAMHAAEALTRADHQGEVREALKVRLPTERDDRRRCGLARELARAGDRTSLPVLREGLAKPAVGVRTAAAESLFKIGEPGDAVLLRRAMGRQDQAPLRLMAAAAFAGQGDRQALALIRRELAGPDAEARGLAAWVLAHVGGRSDVGPLTRVARAEKDPVARARAWNALACLGDAAGLAELERNFGTSDNDIRAEAAEAAAACPAADLVSSLTRLLDDPALDVRVRAAQALLARVPAGKRSPSVPR